MPRRGNGVTVGAWGPYDVENLKTPPGQKRTDNRRD
jgi:hypothetical protein